MSTTPPNVLQLARQGNPDAIAALMNRHLEVQGITAQVVQQESALWVSLEAAQVPNQSELVAYVKKGIVGLELATVNQLTISGKQWGSDADAWREQLTLQAPEPDLAAIDLDGGAIAAPDNSQALADNAMTAEEFDLDLALADSLGEASPEAPTDLDLEFVDSPADFELNFTDDDDLGVAADLDLGLGDGADGADDFDLNFMDGDGDLGDLGTADLDLGSASVSDLDLDLGFDEAGSPPAADLDFDLGLSDGPVAASPTDDLDFDLGLIDEPAPADAVADLDLDFDLLDEPAAMPADDSLEMDFGLSDGPVNADPGADFDLDLELGEGPGDAAPPDFDLDLGEELDLGGLDAAATPAADSDFDLDFGGLDEPAPADALDMDLGLLDEPAPADALDM
ncbi:MAG TPA: hypothetical protein VLS96_19815, partial [Nodosilinea sp.]|nr:hypothetical protein [Nodosilinea sp.]